MFINALSDFMQHLKSGVDFDEWYLSNFIDKNINILSKEDAFDKTSHIIKIIDHDLKSNELYEVLQILLALQRHSDTTQRPKELENRLNLFTRILNINSEDYIVDTVKELKNIYDLE
ncbi:hypothetical protein [Acinetobacter sp. MD2(2019)]|uniref:hypothetical protein n=1 Tax=Acinetobacter sp. MD2(2019) TaxID=2605273 RepID=UPI002D1E7ED8|nr:hypothetical protein [Acinetobacter sp. MD2(2019)]MEB3755183.1 hypothetical protein [Acinetobacter sp. MD2(2019)]